MKTKKMFTITLVTMLVILVSLTNVRAEAEEISIDDIPRAYEVFCWEVSNNYDLSEALLISLVWQESKFKADEVNGNVSQITNIRWYQEGVNYTCSENPKTNVYENINVLGYYLHKWAEQYPDEPYLWCRMWNEGYENALLNRDYISYYSRTIVDRIPDIEEQLNERMVKESGRLY